MGAKFEGYAQMVTRLEKPLKREIRIDDMPYTLTIAADGLRLAPKGRRRAYALQWRDFVSGEAALAQALQASMASAPGVAGRSRAKKSPPKRA